MARLRIIDGLGPWPVQPLVARADVDSSLLTQVRAAILDLNDDPGVLARLAGVAIDRFVTTEPDHYAPVHAIFDATAR